MTGNKINKKEGAKRVLIVPLDWGLGHATRCLPIIYELKRRGATVFLAGDGGVAELLKNSVPDAVLLPLKGYRIHYSSGSRFFILHLIFQSFSFLKSIRNEHRWLKQIIMEHQIDVVISDNRFGMWTKSKPCYFITHQLQIITNSRLTDFIAKRINWYFIKKFSCCWIMDHKDNGLAGLLSHPKHPPPFCFRYLGLSSRFKKSETLKSEHILFLISGPEPSRTQFENIILQQIEDVDQPVILVRGLPDEKNLLSHQNNQLVAYNHLNSETLADLIASASVVICRAGYSTLMDLATLQVHAIIVPTPGQTEQEYLSSYLHQKKLFFQCRQEQFKLEEVIKQYHQYQFSNNWPKTYINTDIFEEFLFRLNN